MTTWTPTSAQTSWAAVQTSQDLFPLTTESGLTLTTETGVTILAFPDNHLWGPDSPSGVTWTRIVPP